MTKIVVLERHVGAAFTNLTREVELKLCENEKLDYYHLLSLARLNRVEFAYNMMRRAGYHAELRGEIIYILNCKPITATIRHTNNTCYQEIPFAYNGTAYFVRPKSRVLTIIGTQIDCQ